MSEYPLSIFLPVELTNELLNFEDDKFGWFEWRETNDNVDNT